MPSLREKELYPGVAQWLKRHFRCFETGLNKGLRYGRIDVTGIRDIGGDLSGAIETVGVEVKRGSFPFSNACGQTLGYTAYVNRAYLADVRSKGFTSDEIHIASKLGIGLIQIHKGRCFERLSSPLHAPLDRLNLRLVETLGYVRCQICDCFFDHRGQASTKTYAGVARSALRAVNKTKGYMFWNSEVADRKRKLKLRVTNAGSYERRFICPGCVDCVFFEFGKLEQFAYDKH
jgi:hypothetical protein